MLNIVGETQEIVGPFPMFLKWETVQFPKAERRLEFWNLYYVEKAWGKEG
mgnify:CR=1 FL=1